VSRDTLYQLLDKAKTKVLDINLRPPHFQRPHIEYLVQQAHILKMNEAELELISNWYGHHETTEEKIKNIQDRFALDTVIVTMGGNGAMVSEKGKLHQHPGFRINVADTIGSGDAFLAGFIQQTLQGASIETALSFASAMGAFVATQHGACPSYNVAQITALMQTNSVSKT
jgi:fructokinase